MPTQRLTIFLLRDVTTFNDAIDADVLKQLSISDLDQTSGLVGRFYSKPSFSRTPAWVAYLKTVVSGGVQGVQSSSASGLLVLKVDDQTYALTFGYGRSFLNQAKVERRFGLKVAVNLIDERQIRSLDTKKFDEMVVSTNTQTSRTTELPTFGVDIHRDILRAVTGVAPEHTGYKALSGADALVLGVDHKVTDLPRLLRDIFSHYGAKNYEKSFGWIDQLAEVRDPDLVESLDAQLVGQLAVPDTSATHLALPENLDWEDIEHFCIAPNGKKAFDELDLDLYLSEKATTARDLTVARLKQRKVSVKFLRSTDIDTRWSVYQCLISEQRLNGQLYALIEGRWFAVSESLVEEVDDAVSAISPATVKLPDALPGETEDAYNARAARSVNDLILLDRKLLAPEGATTRIEFCDLMSKSGSLVHVKRKARSSTLSHLFAQGHVSAEALFDGTLRDKVRSVIAGAAGSRDATDWLNLVPPSHLEFDRERVAITYAVITNGKAEGIEWLPFFSRLNLMQTVRSLHRLGFRKVELARVSVKMPPD